MKIKFYALISFLLAVLWSCDRHPYIEMERRELASGKQVDSIMMGMHFGMSVNDFFDQCKTLNKQQLVYQGPGSMTVEFIAEEGFNSSVRVHFRPKFYQEELFEMTYEYVYEAWAPWNKEYNSETLLMDVKDWMEKKYGSGFVEIKKEGVLPAYAKVDGNRRIHIKALDEVRVEVNFTDLPVAKTIEEQSKDLTK